ncbi:sensor domain-containing diguanylate cyclase [Magnetospirillum sp. SS-4]|uniref:sensor domain-containing diguanylate cyclase n=1 Tax=Magnetospirillum sp. SS-4 TaxID=2681465 RepID=UPI001384386D|nr:sensor domain-containing diguanylate cyclase [Magnetospirillum sp. SS-4]CAA7627131.1 putative Diguanylate cyclase [Magnetospirillum sp. SS-4]
MSGAFAARRIRVSIALIWVALTLLAVHVYIDLNRSYQDARERGVRLATSYARLVAEHAAGTFDRADLVLERAVRLPQPEDLASARRLDDSRRAGIETGLKAIQAKAPAIVSMTMTDHDGYAFANTVGTPPGGNLGDRGYFLALKAGGPEPAVSEVVKGRISNIWGIQVARSIPVPGGGFGGMVVANVGMTSYMEGFYGGLSLPPGSIVSLRDLQHRLLVRHPVREDLFGKVIPSGEFAPLFQAGGDEGIFDRVSPIDGVMRLVAVKKLAKYDIYAVVGIPETEVLGAWMQSRDQAIVILALALAVAVVATLLSHWKGKVDTTLRTQLSFQDALFDTLPIPIFTRDADGRFATCNKAYERYFGTRREDLIGKTVYDVFPGELAANYDAADREVLDGSGNKTYEIAVVAADGSTRQVIIDKACYQGADGRPGGIVATVVDITERETMERELWRLATTDPLTGVGNRRHFLSIAEAELGKVHRHGRPLSVVTFDIDWFKQINDRFGHGVGDDVIKAVAGVCTGVSRDIDVVGRMGGEEFAILLPETDLAAAMEVARRLHERIGDIHIATDKGELSVTASFGVTQVRPDDGDIDIALRRADQALYEAKETGRDKVVFRD